VAEKRALKIDINHASAEEIVSLNGIGASLAQKIISQRPYQQMDDLVRVPGINQVKLESLKPFITIAAAKEKLPVEKPSLKEAIENNQPISTVGGTEAFVFLEDRNERQDAFLIILGGFILGLVILLLRRANK